MKLYTVTYKTGTTAASGVTYKTLHYAKLETALEMAKELVNNASKASEDYGVSIRTLKTED